MLGPICFLLVSNYQDSEDMVERIQFCKVLPFSQTVLAIFFGGWGLWTRNSILSRPMWGGTGWDTTLRFHVWPWPFKFAAILNMPALLAGALLSWPLDNLLPRFPDWGPTLLLTPLFWYWVGSWTDKHFSSGENGKYKRGRWAMLLLFMGVCTGASSIPRSVGGYTNYVLFGIAIWVVAAIAMKATPSLRRANAELT